jgi:hypothetical protein
MCLISLMHGVTTKSININFFIVNITGYCPQHGRVAGHVTFTTVGSHIQKVQNRWPMYSIYWSEGHLLPYSMCHQTVPTCNFAQILDNRTEQESCFRLPRLLWAPQNVTSVDSHINHYPVLKQFKKQKNGRLPKIKGGLWYLMMNRPFKTIKNSPLPSKCFTGL